jgi:hypothetical protein
MHTLIGLDLRPRASPAPHLRCPFWVCLSELAPGGCEPSSSSGGEEAEFIVERRRKKKEKKWKKKKKWPGVCHPEPTVAPYYLQAVAFSRVAFREETRWKALIGASS